MSRLKGAIFPVPLNLVDGLFTGGPKVFVKYTPHYSIRLTRGNMIIFYESRGSKRIIGEARINDIEFLAPEDVIKKHGELLFISIDQFNDYVNQWPNRDKSKKMLTATLTRLRRYSKQIKYDKPITMAGRYITTEEYNELLGNAK